MATEFRARMVGRVAILRWRWRSIRYLFKGRLEVRRWRVGWSTPTALAPLHTVIRVWWEPASEQSLDGSLNPIDRILPLDAEQKILDWLSERGIPVVERPIIGISRVAHLTPNERFEFKLRWL